MIAKKKVAPDLSSKEFVHLHVHSHNSLLDGMSTEQEIASTVAAQGSRAFALTDHGYVSGLYSAHVAAKDLGVKFIPGVESYLCNDNTKPETRKKQSVKKGEQENYTYHMLLLAQNETGLHNLYNLSSEGTTIGEFGANAKRVTDAHLEQFSEGLIATSGCLSSRVSRYLLRGDYERAREAAAAHRDMFGPENYFVEIQNHGIDDQIKILGDQLRLAKDLGVGLVATNDSHYTDQCDAETHDHMLAVNTAHQGGGGGILAPDRFHFDGDQHYIKTAAEMYELFPERDFPGACKNTLEIADRVEDIEFTDGSLLIPEFEYEEYGYSSADEMLEDRARRGLEELMNGNVPKRYIEQMEFELNVIRNMGIQSYFLIVAAILEYCRENRIWSGPGRGSAAGSIVVYALRITKVDPIEHGLIFSRFLNAGRTDSMPDIDLDIEPSRREEVVEYMAERWGHDRVVNISTHQTFKGKAALVKVGQAHEVEEKGQIKNYKSLAESAKAYVHNSDDLLTDMIKPAPKTTGDPEKDAEQREKWQTYADLRNFIDRSDPEFARCVELAGRLQFRNFTNGIHPAGVLITPGPVREYFPIRNPKKKKDQSKEDIQNLLKVCQFNCGEVDKLKGLKMDLLGLKNLSVIELAVRKIERDLGEVVDLDNIPMDDPAVYELLRNADVSGVFQIESGGMRELIRKVQPTSFADISALIALFRPGPMGMNSHNIYADRKNGREKVEYFHDDAKEILEETYGLVVYQEQVMAIAQKFAGFTEKEADDFRRAIGKKKKEVMEEKHAEFVQRVADNGYSKQLGSEIWETIEPFVGYAFNKAHSVSYGFITYQTAWLKANYYAQYVAAYIDVFPDKSSEMSSEAISRGVSIHSPDVNKSLRDSKTTKDNAIHVGFGLVSSFNSGIEDVVRERELNGPFTSIVDFVARTSVNKTATASLIKSGAFESLDKHTDRQSMLDSMDEIMSRARDSRKQQADKAAFGGSLFDSFSSVNEEETEMRGLAFGKHKPKKREARIMERDGLGFFVGKHPFTDFEPVIDQLRDDVPAMEHALSTRDVLHDKFIGKGHFFGCLVSYEESTSKRGNMITKYVLDCGDQSSMTGRLIGHGHFTEDDLLGLVLVDGEVEEDIFSAPAQQEVVPTSDDDPTAEAQKTQESYNLDFKFGASPTVVMRDSSGDVSDEIMQMDSKSAEEKSSGAQRSSRERKPQRTANVKSSKTTKKNNERERISRRSQSVADARTVQKRLADQRTKKTAKQNGTPVLLSFRSHDDELCELLFMNICYALLKNSDDQEGRIAYVAVNDEICNTKTRIPVSRMPSLRNTIKELAKKSMTTISVSDLKDEHQEN